MNTLVIDASVVIKWVVTEDGSAEALALRTGSRLVGPDLLAAECANILWKKVRRGELTEQEAKLAAGLIERSGVDFMPMHGLLRSATELAIKISHPAYDCLYLCLAVANGWVFVTADEKLVRKLRQQADGALASAVQTLTEAANST